MPKKVLKGREFEVNIICCGHYLTFPYISSEISVPLLFSKDKFF
jgi:hypothetical protein